MRMRIDKISYDRIIRKFDVINNGFKDEFEKVAYMAGLLIEDEAKRILKEMGHIDTGMLWNSIETMVARKGNYKLSILIGTDVYYSIYIEALPDGGFLFPAYLRKRKDVLKLLGKGIKMIIKTGKVSNATMLKQKALRRSLK